VRKERQGKEAVKSPRAVAFDEKTSGGLMKPEFVFVGETATRDEVAAVDARAGPERGSVN